MTPPQGVVAGRPMARRATGLVVLGLCLGVWLPGVAAAQSPPTSPALQSPSATASPVPAFALRQLVIPFENATHDPRGYWLSEASAVLLTDDLLALGVSAITRDDRLRAFERLRVPPVATLSYATVIRIGQIVGAERVIVGTFELRGDEFTVRARPIRLDTGRMFPEIVESGPLMEIFATFSRLARKLTPASRVPIELMEQTHPPVTAFEMYVKGVLAENPATQLSFLTQALRLSPTFQEPRIALWRVHTDQGEHQQALDTTREVPAGHALYRRARFLGALSLISLAQYQTAVDILTELNTARADAGLLNDIGVAQLRRPAGAAGGKATAHFMQAIQIDPNDPDLFFNLGYAYWLERDTQAAITSLREVVRRNPSDGAAHYVLGVALQAGGSGAEAAREKELARQLSSTYAEWETRQPRVNAVPRGLERLTFEIDRPAVPRVEDVIVAAEQRDQRELATLHLESGRRLFQAERDDEAIAELRRAVFLAPYQSEAHLLLGRAYLRTGRVQNAIDALKISIWSEDTIAAHVALAEAYLQGKNPSAARVELDLVVKRDPRNADARRLLDRLLLK